MVVGSGGAGLPDLGPHRVSPAIWSIWAHRPMNICHAAHNPFGRSWGRPPYSWSASGKREYIKANGMDCGVLDEMRNLT